MEKPASSVSFEFIRHGHKLGENLSPIGVEQAHVKAEEIFQRIQELPSPAVVCFFASNIGRAKDTNQVMVDRLRELCAADPSMVMASIQDLTKIEAAKTDGNQKLLLIDTGAQTSLGFNPDHDPAEAAYTKYKDRYKDEDTVGKIWIARQSELPALQAELNKQYPEIDSSDINPADFIQTPEEFVKNFLTFMRITSQAAHKHFPGRPTYIVGTSHNYSVDFSLLNLADKSIDLEGINAFGGKFRDFVESSLIHIDEQNGAISVEYRGQAIEAPGNITDRIKRLDADMLERKTEWDQMSAK